jgi:hypothetical protein
MPTMIMCHCQTAAHASTTASLACCGYRWQTICAQTWPAVSYSRALACRAKPRWQINTA